MYSDMTKFYERELNKSSVDGFIYNYKDNLDEILSNSNLKTKLAQKIYNESLSDRIWDYYRNFVLYYGVNLLLKIYNHSTIEKLNDEEDMRYVIISVMLENDVNKILDYALSDKEFFEILKDHANSYFHFFNNIDFNIITKYTSIYPSFVSKYFILKDEEIKKILINPELPLPILVHLISNIQNSSILSWFFHNVPRSFEVFHALSKDTIKNLIINKVDLPKRILSSDYFFESIKEDSIVNIRKLVNKTIDNYGYIEIEDKLLEYYKIVMKERNKKLADVIVDYLFKDDIYNVFINLKEIISYHDTLDNKLLDDKVINFFKTILNIDNLSKEEKLDLFNKYCDKKVYLVYYNSLYLLKEHMHNELHQSLTVIDSNQNIIDYRDRKYYLLVRCMNTPYKEKTDNRRDCYSLINDKNNEVFYGKYIYGYNSFDINRIIHVYEHDAFSHQNDGNNTSDYINRLFHPNELVEATSSINEIQVLNYKDGDSYIAMKPDYMIAIDEVNELTINESNRLNIPIVLISSSLEEHMGNIDNLIRVFCNTIESDYSAAKYTSDRGITPLEEKIRVKSRFSR